MKQVAKAKNQPSPAPKNNPEKEVIEYMKPILLRGLNLMTYTWMPRRWRRS
jgi:hypothetical protein